jgi:hypothetical protein
MSYFTLNLSVFFSIRRNNMRVTYRNLAIVGFVIIIVLGMGFLVMTRDVKMEYISKDIQRDHARFTPSESIDVAQAMKLVTHDPPKMLAPPEPIPPLLLFPPSPEDLERISGGGSLLGRA